MLNFKQYFQESANDLIKNINDLPDMDAVDVKDLYRQIDSGLLPSNSILSKDFNDRKNFVQKFSWSIPCKEAIEAFKKYARPPILDVMAGSGYWSKILNERGIKVIPYDLHKSSHNKYKHKQTSKIKRSHALKTTTQTLPRYMKKYDIPGDIILSWPPYDKPIGYEILKSLPVGARVFYFGESHGGCTGCDKMHEYMNNNFKKIDFISLPKFQGLYDDLYIIEKIS